MNDLDKYRGCLLGGAVGDALGFAVEFLTDTQIFRKYGANGITRYELNAVGKAEISDDTQMTLFTANGLLLGTARALQSGGEADYVTSVWQCYRDWLKTQNSEGRNFLPPEHAWLNCLPDLNSRRAPGQTCIGALTYNAPGTIEAPCNNSKGCGGVMRVAPVGLYLGGRSMPSAQADMIAARTAALTHGHELGYIPAAALSHIVSCAAHGGMTLRDAVEDAKNAVATLFAGAEHIDDFTSLLNQAVTLAEQEIDDLEALWRLGAGWVGEEALAIAVYCALRHQDSFEDAIIAAVNHEGDSDSTGAVTGSILGAYLGMRAIPPHLLEPLELRETIIELADDLFFDLHKSGDGAFDDPRRARKYARHN